MSDPRKLSERMLAEADDLDKASGEKTKDGRDWNYQREDRHAMIAEAKQLRELAKEVIPLESRAAELQEQRDALQKQNETSLSCINRLEARAEAAERLYNDEHNAVLDLADRLEKAESALGEARHIAKYFPWWIDFSIRPDILRRWRDELEKVLGVD